MQARTRLDSAGSDLRAIGGANAPVRTVQNLLHIIHAKQHADNHHPRQHGRYHNGRFRRARAGQLGIGYLFADVVDDVKAAERVLGLQEANQPGDGEGGVACLVGCAGEYE